MVAMSLRHCCISVGGGSSGSSGGSGGSSTSKREVFYLMMSVNTK
jgi:hypothetical protein